MSCVLRARGTSFDVEKFLASSTLKPLTVWRAGNSQSPRSTPQSTSGFHVAASDADFDNPKQQIADTIQFVRANGAELRRLAKFPGVEGVEFDFGIADRDVPAQSDRFSPELLRALGDLNATLAITRYPAKE
jgi:hypothetical protein